jgi:E3 ubiquitin-protein ligase SIAH1
MAALLDHCSTTHKWPCITAVKPDDKDEFTIDLHLHDGFNFLLADCSTGNKNQGATASNQCLLLLTVVRQPYVRIISVHCIDPHAAAGSGAQGATSKEMQCLLDYSLRKDAGILSGNNPFINSWQIQVSRFRVVRTDLSNGLPKPDDCFQVVVPNSVIEDHDKDGIKVKLHIIII